MSSGQINKITFVTVCTDKYPMHYAAKICNRFRSLSKLEFDCLCITDRPSEVGSWGHSIHVSSENDTWWNKVHLFGPNMPDGWLVYLDLDIVILQNFDDEILFAIDSGCSLACVEDAIRWKGEKFSSSLMVMKSHCYPDIFRNYIINKEVLRDRPGGDQVWLGPLLKDVLYLNEEFPYLKKNLKYDLATINGRDMFFPPDIDPKVKLVDCTGHPKPHDLSGLSYIYENWHKIDPV